MSQANTPQSFWYKGDLQIARYSGATLGGYSDVLNGLKVTIKADGDPKRITSNKIADFGQTQKLSFMPKPTEVEIEVSDPVRHIFAAALLGTDSAFSQSAAASQSVTVTLIEGQWVKLGKYNVENVAITSKVLGTDFDVLPKLGMIKALNSGTAGSQTVTFDAGAVAGDKIAIGTRNVIDFAVLMLVENNADGLQGILEIPKISVTPAKAFELLGAKDYQSAAFKGEIISLTGQDPATFYPNLTFS
jgi:hypothetical protein